MEDNGRAVRYGLARRISDLKHLRERSVDAVEQEQASLIIEDLEEIYQALG